MTFLGVDISGKKLCNFDAAEVVKVDNVLLLIIVDIVFVVVLVVVFIVLVVDVYYWSESEKLTISSL